MKIYDLSIPISPTIPIYPGDPPVVIEPVKQITTGSKSNVSRLSFGSHTATHVDPPSHFISGGKSVDQLDLNILYGAAYVLDMTHVERAITAKDLEKADLPKQTRRVLFKTRNSSLWEHNDFQKDYIAFAWDAAQWLVDNGIQLVGIDYLSVELFDSREPRSHRTLLGAGVILVEGLNLNGIASGQYTLVCLPMKIKEGNGAPARTILIEE